MLRHGVQSHIMCVAFKAHGKVRSEADMGEFVEQVMGGGPSLVPMAEVHQLIPGLAEDLGRGADARAAMEAILRIAPREVPPPHAGYGHLVLRAASARVPAKAEDCVRAVAAVVGDAHGAPVLGSSCGDLPRGEVAAALRSHGFATTAAAWLEAVRRELDELATAWAGALVWETGDPSRDAAVALCGGRYVSVDWAVCGERVTRCRPTAEVRGVPWYVSAFNARYGHSYGRPIPAPGLALLRRDLEKALGEPRGIRLLPAEG